MILRGMGYSHIPIDGYEFQLNLKISMNSKIDEGLIPINRNKPEIFQLQFTSKAVPYSIIKNLR